MSKYKFVLNRSGVAELLKGAEMREIIQDCTTSVQEAAGAIGTVGKEGYKSEVKNGGQRVYGVVSCDSAHAYHSNMKHNTLLKALGSVKRS